MRMSGPAQRQLAAHSVDNAINHRHERQLGEALRNQILVEPRQNLVRRHDAITVAVNFLGDDGFF
jgi:hypothetical protein